MGVNDIELLPGKPHLDVAQQAEHALLPGNLVGQPPCVKQRIGAHHTHAPLDGVGGL